MNRSGTASETDKALFCTITRHFISMIYTDEVGNIAK